MRLRLFPMVNVAVACDAEAVTKEPEVKKETIRPPVFNYLEPVSSTLIPSSLHSLQADSRAHPT